MDQWTVEKKGKRERELVITLQGFPGGSGAKKPPANAGDTRDSGSVPGQEGPLEKEMATHSSILAWGSPWTEELGGLTVQGVPKVT